MLIPTPIMSKAEFEKLEFFVVQDVFFSRTAQYADVKLPAAPSLEKDGTFTNTERRIQRFYKVLSRLAVPSLTWQIIQELANRLGADWNYRHPSEIMAEAASLCPAFQGSAMNVWRIGTAWYGQ